MSIGTFRIETNSSANPMHWRVFLDDQEITQVVSKITVTASAEENVARVALECVAVVEFPQTLLAHVSVEVKELA
jgi:hypothetical protein